MLEELLERYQAHDDEDAMAELVRRTRPRLLRVAARICPGEAEDAVQTAYLSLARKQDAALGAPVLPWLVKAVVRIAYRRRARQARESEIARRLAPAPAAPPSSAAAIGREEAELLERALDRLPARYRDPLQLHYLHGLSLKETARLLGLNESTLRTRLTRGRRLLRRRLSHLLHPVLALPWWLADTARAAALSVGILMKSKLAVVAAVLALVAAGTAVHLTNRAPAPSPARASRNGAVHGGPASVADAAHDADENESAASPELAQTAVYAAGVVVDGTGAPVADVRVIARGASPDETNALRARRMAEARRLNVPPDLHFGPDRIDDALRAKPPVARTDADGRFRVDRKPQDRYSLLFVKEGYAIAEETKPARDLRVVLAATRPVYGVVTDTAGVPLAGATVRASTGYLTSIQETSTDDGGRYRFDCLPANLRSVAAFSPGYRGPGTRNPKFDAPEDFRLARYCIVVDVTDADTGKPVAGSTAFLTTPDGRPFRMLLAGGYTSYGGSGRPGRHLVGPDPTPLLEKTPAVDAIVVASAPGYQAVREPVTLRKDAEFPHLRIGLTRAPGSASIAGQVRGASRAHVVVRDATSMHVEDYRFVTETDTDAGGWFAFSGLPRSGYLVIVTASGKGTLTTKVETPATDLVLEMTDAARLEVLATNSEDAPAAGVVVHVEQPDGWRFWNAETDDNGLAVFADLPAQRVSVVALPTIRPGPLHRYDIPAAEVALTAGQQRRLRIQVVDRVSVRLAVTDRQGQRHEGVVLGFRSRGRGPVGAVAGAGEWKRLEALRVTTDATGEATADLFPGEYSVMLAKGATPVRLVRCTIDADAANRLELVVPRKPTVLRGRVRDHVTGKPVRDLMVSVREKGDTWAVADVRTDAEGRFELIGLPSGPLSVNCLSTGIRGPKLYTGAQVDFSDRNRIELDLYVVPPDTKKNCRVAVTVRDADGAPLADAFVMVSAKLGDGTVIAGRARTDDQGLVVVRAIEADEYRLFVRPRGAEQIIRVVPRTGVLTEATIKLEE